MASISSGPERHHLARQVQAFRIHAKKLKKIFKDTVKVLSDLQDFDESLSIDQILAVNAQKCISNVVSGRTALVVFGETKLRVSIVNEILGKKVLVVSWDERAFLYVKAAYFEQLCKLISAHSLIELQAYHGVLQTSQELWWNTCCGGIPVMVEFPQ